MSTVREKCAAALSDQLAPLNLSVNQLSVPKMWMPPAIHLPGYPSDGPQTLAELEAHLIDKFGWRDGANYMTVDGPGTDGMSEVWQWDVKPTKLIYAEDWSNFGVDIPAAALIDLILLPENIDWKDCLFTRATGTNE